MRNRHLYILAAVLCFLGAGLFLYKVFVLELPLRPEAKVKNWEVEARVDFIASGAPVRVSLFLPQTDGHYTIIDESFLSEGFGLTTSSDGDNRRAVFSVREATGEQTLYYRFVVYRSLLERSEPPADEPVPAMPQLNEAEMSAARGLVRELIAKSADDDTLIRLVLKSVTASPLPDATAMLLGHVAGTKKRMEVAAQMLALAGIAARAVNGIQLVDFNRDANFSYWLEALVDGRWVAYAGQSQTGMPPETSFPWWRGTAPVATVEGGTRLSTTITISAASVPALRSAIGVNLQERTNLLAYSLFTLPLSTQQVYRIILTVPIGVFFLTLLRNVVGLRTFGTFMPVLIAIAFRETHLLWGVVLFTLVVSIGLLIRLYFENLRLLVVPRLASVLIVVVLAMAGISILSNQLGFQRGLSVALFPMVILTMTVERMSIIWDERGPAEMLRLGVGSLIIAIIAYLIMVNPYVEHLCLVFPELLLIVLAGNLLLGRYSGYRLLDLPRFRVLAGQTD